MSDHGSDNSIFKYQRDLRKEYETYIKEQLDSFNLEKIYDELIDKSVIINNFHELLECGYRWCLIKGFHQESLMLAKYLELIKSIGIGYYDYLDCITVIHYSVNKKSFSCLFT